MNTSRNAEPDVAQRQRLAFDPSNVVFVLGVALFSVVASVLFTVMQTGFEPVAIRTAVLIPLAVSVPVATWMARQNAKILDLNEHLTVLVRRDPLTGLLNRRAFLDEAENAVGIGGVLILCDVDRFKAVNDGFGHAGGDAALKALASALSEAAGNDSIIGRLGGEEFGVFVPGVSQEDGRMIAERLRRKVGSQRVQFSEDVIKCTMSFGVHFLKAAQRDGAAILGDAMAAADSALYIAKGSGRDRVVSTCDATRGKARTLMSSGSVQMH